MPLEKLEVELDERAYPIFIKPGLLNEPEVWTPYIRGRDLVIVTNETVARFHLETLRNAVDFFNHEVVVLPDGEHYKKWETLNLVFDGLIEGAHSRQTTVMAFGGGVIGDLAGFSAACYQRGIDYIQVPSTLLAQVDSSVGGKTGINHPLGKNMIGAFHQPQAVVIDTELLKTLPIRELSAGIAEIIKYGLINDAAFFVWLEQNIENLMALDEESLRYAIKCSCANKADIVAQDEKEGGVRALLNLGHTFGHAIEAYMGYSEWLHGEAVATGLVMASRMSVLSGWLSNHEAARIVSLVERAGLPSSPPYKMSADDFLQHMAIDKKVEAGKVRLVLLSGVGEAFVTKDYDQEMLRATLMG